MDHLELDIKEMMELGKRAAVTRNTSTSVVDGEVPSTENRSVCTVEHEQMAQ